MALDDVQNKFEEDWKNYGLLGNDAKIILQILALLGHDCEEKHLVKGLQINDILTSEDKEVFATKNVSQLLDVLQQNKFVDKQYSGRCIVFVDPRFLHELRKQAVTNVDVVNVFETLCTRYYSSEGYYFYNYTYSEYMLRNLSFFLYTNQEQKIRKYLKQDNSLHSPVNDSMLEIWNRVIFNLPFDASWLKNLSIGLKYDITVALWERATFFIDNVAHDIFRFVMENFEQENFPREILAEYYLLTGDHDKFLEAFKNVTNPYVEKLLFADYLFIQDRLPEALKMYQEALKIARKLSGSNKVFLPYGYHGIFYMFTYAACMQGEQTLRFLERVEKSSYRINYLFIFRMLIRRMMGNEVNIENVNFDMASKEVGINILLAMLSFYYLSPDIFEENLQKFSDFFSACVACDYKVFAFICAEMLAKNEQFSGPCSQYIEKNRAVVKIRLLEKIQVRPIWEITLQQLSSISKNQEVLYEQGVQTSRLVWLLNTEERSVGTILYPAVQEKGKNGYWKKPKRILLEKFHGEVLTVPLTEKDKQIKEHLVKRLSFYRDDLEWNRGAALKSLVGHPFIYDQSYECNKIELVEENVYLMVTENANKFNVKLSHYTDRDMTKLVPRTPFRYALVSFDATLLQLAKILNEDGLTLPLESKEKLLDAIKDLVLNLDIHSSISVTDITTQPASPKIEVQLMPYDQGLQVNVVVRPCGDFGAVCMPGEGNKFILAANKMQKLQVVRDFDLEKENFKNLCKTCKNLNKNLNVRSFQTTIENPRECLKVLSELKAVDDKITVSWPRGEMLRVQANLSFDNLKLRVKKEHDWFSVDGDVIVDNKKFMSIKELLDLLDYNDDPFIPLSTDRFISLNNHFKEQLQKLKNIAVRGESGYQLHKLSSYAVDDVIKDCRDVELDQAWNEQLQKLLSNANNVIAKKNYKLSPGFKATLRPYQVEGVNWLRKMARMDMGVCLADDMGLGKTVQAIALILDYAKSGACLIVAPTSVCYNWVAELQKFAPTLKTHLFASVIDREELLRDVTAKDVVICSYGLVQRNIALLHKIVWQVVIIDEAQAIKNSNAKRTQAVYQLQGNVRLALTGTPIENHLGELWSLFRLLNPGFLGSEESFFKRFIVPIEQHKNEYARTTLKNLIKPFILRRMKDSVLKDLPPKTETTIMVDLSEEERGFYESLRLKAIENVAKGEGEEHEGKQRFKILAEITKLRLACCHSTLVYGEVDLPNSKLEQFTVLLDSILENQHRVLVFSQFVRYLDIVKNLLQEKAICYQYLDGQTPQAQRKTIVEDFQNGKSSVFLLSLKAGGVGLNLTAADYVILLDPWWNPAVENQAADRAHRIGQTKPVNIYRLISKQTVEEKILQLHQVKKDLANDILGDADMSGKLTTKELLDLIGKV